MKSEVLNLGKHFLTIDSTIPFELYNPITQTTINKASGRWVIDCWKLLTKEYFKNNPQFVLELRYDETLLVNNHKIECHTTDIDIGSIQSEYQLVTVANLETAGLATERTLDTVAKESTLNDVKDIINIFSNNFLDSLDLKFGNEMISEHTYYFKKDTILYGELTGNIPFIVKADSNVVCQLVNRNLNGIGYFLTESNTSIVKSSPSTIVSPVISVCYLTDKMFEE